MAFFDMSLHNTALIELSQVKRHICFPVKSMNKKNMSGGTSQILYRETVFIYNRWYKNSLMHDDLLYDVAIIEILNNGNNLFILHSWNTVLDYRNPVCQIRLQSSDKLAARVSTTTDLSKQVPSPCFLDV